MNITLDEIKSQCRIDDDGQDELLEVYLAAAIATIENYTNRKRSRDHWRSENSDLNVGGIYV